MLSSSIGVAAADFLPVVCDVTKEAEVVNLPKIITKHWPDAGLDVLVNNAGAPGEVVVDYRCMWLAGWLAGMQDGYPLSSTLVFSSACVEWWEVLHGFCRHVDVEQRKAASAIVDPLAVLLLMTVLLLVDVWCPVQVCRAASPACLMGR